MRRETNHPRSDHRHIVVVVYFIIGTSYWRRHETNGVRRLGNDYIAVQTPFCQMSMTMPVRANTCHYFVSPPSVSLE